MTEPMPINQIAQKNRRPKKDQREESRKESRHVDNGFPHYSSKTLMCMCLDSCCNGINGCKCRGCPCRTGQMEHGGVLRLTLGNTISSTGAVSEKSG